MKTIQQWLEQQRHFLASAFYNKNMKNTLFRVHYFKSLGVKA